MKAAAEQPDARHARARRQVAGARPRQFRPRARRRESRPASGSTRDRPASRPTTCSCRAARADALAQLAPSVAACTRRCRTTPTTPHRQRGHYQRVHAARRRRDADGARVIEINPGDATLEPRKIAPTLLLDVTTTCGDAGGDLRARPADRRLRRRSTKPSPTINERPRPLALYYFDGDRRAQARARADRLRRRHHQRHAAALRPTTCRSAASAPSGLGAYHGERGFLTFTHEKPVFAQPRIALTWMLQPPCGKRFEAMLKLLRRIS